MCDKRSIGLLLAALCAGSLACAAETATVTVVVDGDTLRVDLGGRVEKVRLIGVNTPETVHPRLPVEHFGKAASDFTRDLALGRKVRLEGDSQCRNRDRYGRLLRYVYLPDGKLLNAEIITLGYGHAYVQFPFSKMDAFRALERQAREANRGLWGDAQAPPDVEAGEPAPPASKDASAGSDPVVYVTRTGTHYHRSGCRHLEESSIPIKLSAASASYLPCAVCSPPSARPPR